MNSAMPMRPSLPTTEISADAPSANTYNSDTMESVGKYTWWQDIAGLVQDLSEWHRDEP